MNSLRTQPRYADVYDEAEVHCQNEGQGPSADEIEAAHRSKLDAVAEAGAREAYCRATGISRDEFDRVGCSPTEAIERLVRDAEKLRNQLALATHAMGEAQHHAQNCAVRIWSAKEAMEMDGPYALRHWLRSALGRAEDAAHYGQIAIYVAAGHYGPQGPELA